MPRPSWAPHHRIAVSEFIRFVVVGAANTLATLVLYWVLLALLHYQAAYVVSYCGGIALSFYFNSRFVFRSRPSWAKAARFPLVYAASYAAGALVLGVVVERFGISATIAPLIAVAVTLPLTFVLSRLVLRDSAGGDGR